VVLGTLGEVSDVVRQGGTRLKTRGVDLSPGVGQGTPWGVINLILLQAWVKLLDSEVEAEVVTDGVSPLVTALMMRVGEERAGDREEDTEEVEQQGSVVSREITEDTDLWAGEIPG